MYRAIVLDVYGTVVRDDVDAAEVVHVGDSLSSDVAGAAALGIDTALLDRRGTASPMTAVPTFTASTLTALLPLLDPRAAPGP